MSHTGGQMYNPFTPKMLPNGEFPATDESSPWKLSLPQLLEFVDSLEAFYTVRRRVMKVRIRGRTRRASVCYCSGVQKGACFVNFWVADLRRGGLRGGQTAATADPEHHQPVRVCAEVALRPPGRLCWNSLYICATRAAPGCY